MVALIPLVPGVAAAINGLVGVRFFSRRTSGLLASAAMVTAFGLALAAWWQLLALPPHARVHEVVLGTWLPSIPLQVRDGIGALQVDWGFRLDPLAAVMILVVTGVGALIHVYSTAYMHDEPRGSVARFFCYLNLFCFFMLVLVLGSNFLVMFVGWEGVGLCSYLLIGYWYEKKSAADAGKKAFITNRIGDWGFLLGVFLVFATFGTLDFHAVQQAAAAMPIETARFGVLSAITLLLFIGATGKSAQIPLYVWLPDAMEGPTPVSALIHAATMVTAGVYMMGRNAVLFSHAPMVMAIVAVVGVLTAVMAATIALVQHDIKRVLAYSTVSQLGYMFTAMGVGAFSAGIFHLMTHAFFKALLFLCSGSVIHAMAGEQDMRRMGDLRKYLPITFVTMVVGALAIAGVPPLSGFFSKDEILASAFGANKAIWAIGLATALMTAFYMFRLIALTFFGPYRGPAWNPGGGHGVEHPQAAPAPVGGGGASVLRGAHGATPIRAVVHAQAAAWHGPHEAPAQMRFPLMVLAVGAIVAGFVGIPAALGGANAIEQFLAPSFGVMAETGAPDAVTMSSAGELGLMGLSVLVAIAGIWLANKFYITSPDLPDRVATRWPGAYRTLLNKYYVDELYDSTIVAGTTGGGRRLWTFDRRVVDGAVNGARWATVISAWFSGQTDRRVVDGAVNLIARACEEGSYWFRRAQTGLVQNYALLMLFGVFALVSLYLFMR